MEGFDEEEFVAVTATAPIASPAANTPACNASDIIAHNEYGVTLYAKKVARALETRDWAEGRIVKMHSTKWRQCNVGAIRGACFYESMTFPSFHNNNGYMSDL